MNCGDSDQTLSLRGVVWARDYRRASHISVGQTNSLHKKIRMGLVNLLKNYTVPVLLIYFWDMGS